MKECPHCHASLAESQRQEALTRAKQSLREEAEKLANGKPIGVSWMGFSDADFSREEVVMLAFVAVIRSRAWLPGGSSLED